MSSQALDAAAAMSPNGWERLPKGCRNTMRLLNFSMPISSCSRRSINAWKRASADANAEFMPGASGFRLDANA